MTKAEAFTILKEMRDGTTYGSHVCDAFDMGIKALDQPERKKGKWIAHNNPMYSPFDGSNENIYICNQCEAEAEKATNYCPHCGAKMD